MSRAEAVVAGLAALAVALAATPLAAATSTRLGVVDRPGPLKVQEAPVPYLGGLAVFAALAGPLAWTRPSLLVPLAMLVAVGLADDVRGLGALTRLAAEAAAGAVAGAVAPVSGVPGVAGGAVTAVLVVALVNAVNLLDGLDGLASGAALVSALGFSVAGGGARPVGAALAGALGGFLVFNRPPARIYLGDAGAYAVGGALALAAARLLATRDGVAAWAAVPLLLALPLFDTVVAVVRRRRARRPLFAGDRSHVYDQLVDRGRSPAQAVVECVALHAVLTALGVVVLHLAAPWAVGLAAGAGFALAALAGCGGFVSFTVSPNRTEP